jgi:hypothetical protein
MLKAGHRQTSLQNANNVPTGQILLLSIITDNYKKIKNQ